MFHNYEIIFYRFKVLTLWRKCANIISNPQESDTTDKK